MNGADRPRAGEVRLWLADLDRPDWPLHGLTALLDPDERSRAANLVSEQRQRRFVVAHGLLRALAGHCVGTPPSSIAFIRGPSGRPFLGATEGRPAPTVSWSRSGGLGLYAFAEGLEIGVDVEVVRPVTGLLEIARRLLPPEVHAALAGQRPCDRPASFAAWWTRAEACVKARGDGLAATARLVARMRPQALQLTPPGGGAPVVSHDLAIGDRTAAALATSATLPCIDVRRLRPDDLGYLYAPESALAAPAGRRPGADATR